MITKNILHILLLSVFALSSCEKVIVIDLNDADPRIVVEGQITSEAGFNLVSLSKTSSFYSNEEVEMITGAKVEVSDESGNKFELKELQPGLYNNETFKVISSQKYKLHVDIGDDVFEAYSTTSSSVKIDSIKIEINEFGPKNNDGDGSEELRYKITTYFLDKLDEVNFYRLRLIVNDEYMSGFYVVDDRFFDGKTIPYNFGGIVLEDGDKVIVELLGIDEANFNYFYTLQRLQGNGQDITPGNPPTNIIGNAIGIFGASNFDSMDIVFKIDE
ncbi:MAG: DUF4249 domain-containing protein [Flavobacteriales bacterium]|nr:DUF4249 domain-containing protein [Flavobacteriales bacterium]